MQKVSYMGNGSTTEFYFNFPYFENSNVVVTKNNQTATGYNIIGNSGGLNADIPYNGGKVVFETAPTSLDSITISRQLPLSRIVDYQPLARIDPKTLNQDLNYLMEILKDQKDDLDNFSAKYADIVNQDTTQNLLSRLNTVGQQITDLGDISDIRTNITSLQTDVNNPSKWCFMPSNTYIDLNIENNGTYTAPANGYIWLQAGENANAQLYIDVQDTNGTLLYGDGAIMNYGCVFVPIAKGNVAKIKYTAKQFLRFIYAISTQQ